MGPDPEQYEVSTGLERLITAQDPGDKGGIPVVKIIPDGLGQVDLQDAGIILCMSSRWIRSS